MSEQIEQKSNIDEITALIYKRIFGLGTMAGIVTIVIALLLYFVEFQAEAPWQLLGYSGAVGAGVILLLVSQFYFSRGNLQLAEALIPVVVFTAFALPNLFVSGLNTLLLASSVIILAITGFALKVKRTGWWALIGILITAFLIILEFNPPQNRFDITQSGFWNIFIISIVSGLILAILWQLAISIQHTSVRARLMISFVSFAMIPALISIISMGLWTMGNGRDQISNVNSLIIIGSITAVAIAVTIVGAVIITRTITQPINTLTKNMTSYNNKQINSIPALKTDDEIGKFSQILHDLSIDLYQSMTNLDDLVNERTIKITQRSKQLEAAAEIGLAAASIHELDQLLTTASHLISEKLGFYHVGIFLVDNAREYAVLKATNSEGGWRMLTQNHQQKIGEQGGIGLVTHTGEPQINQHIGSSGVYFENPDLPLSRSEITLPLIFGGQVIGALDIHSTEENVFKEEDISVLQVLADQVSAAIDNTRQFENLNTTLEAERLVYSVLSEDAWTNVADQAGVGYTSDKSGTRSTGQSQSALAKQALQLGNTITSKELQPGQNNYPIAVPVKVRGGQPIAVIESQKPKENGVWNADEIQVLEAIAGQLGIALENARLFEQTQNLAQRERIATDVSAKVWSSSDINTILQTAVQELGRALNATEGTIRLRLPETEE